MGQVNEQQQPQDVSVTIHNLFSYAQNRFPFWSHLGRSLKMQLLTGNFTGKGKTMTFDQRSRYCEYQTAAAPEAR